MHIDPISASAQRTAIVISIKGFAAAFFPFSNVWGGGSAAPEMTSLACVGPGELGADTLGLAACSFLLAWPRQETIITDWAGLFGDSRWPPPIQSIAFRRTKLCSSVFYLSCGAIKEFPTSLACSFFAILSPIKCFSGHPLVPWNSHIGHGAALGRTVAAAPKDSWNWISASLAGMWAASQLAAAFARASTRATFFLWRKSALEKFATSKAGKFSNSINPRTHVHTFSMQWRHLQRYTVMTENRLRGDAGMFAEVAAE